MSRSRRQQKLDMWHSDKRCRYCGVETVVDVPAKGQRYPDNLATLDHLDDRFSPQRGKRVSKQRRVLACYKCNAERTRLRMMGEHAEDQRIKSMHGIRGPLTPDRRREVRA